MLRPEDQEIDIGPLDYYILAFSELSSCRPSSLNGVSPIPFTSIAEYARIYGIGDFEEFRYIIRRLDTVYLENTNERNKTNSNKGSDGRR
jgi:hypothetical protein